MLSISRLDRPEFGYEVHLDLPDNNAKILRIDGNDSNNVNPVALLNLDAYSVFGLGHPNVISRILNYGPQTLLTTKELGHKLFENGLKAYLGRVRIGNNHFQSTLETFYIQSFQAGLMSIITHNIYGVCVEVKPLGYKPVYISHTCLSNDEHIYLDAIQTTVQRKLVKVNG
jgi:hypothetical protein